MKAGDIYQSEWLRGADLKEIVKVQITRCDLVSVKKFREQGYEKKIAVSFRNATKRLLLTPTQVNQLTDLFGTDETDVWTGKEIVLSPRRLETGKFTIDILGDSTRAGS